MKYSYAISTLALLAALGACSDSSDSSLGPDGTTGAAPATRLVAVSPPGQATGVDRGGPLMLQFDGAMMPGMEQYVDLHRGDVSSLTHPIACAWSADRTQLICTPAPPLDPGTSYTFHVGGGMRSSNGASILMDPTEHAGSWIHGGSGMMGGGMSHGDDHAGQSWEMMGPGWRAGNGTYGIVCPFQSG
jgi:hypothetical protein